MSTRRKATFRQYVINIALLARLADKHFISSTKLHLIVRILFSALADVELVRIVARELSCWSAIHPFVLVKKLLQRNEELFVALKRRLTVLDLSIELCVCSLRLTVIDLSITLRSAALRASPTRRVLIAHERTRSMRQKLLMRHGTERISNDALSTYHTTKVLLQLGSTGRLARTYDTSAFL